MDKNANPPSRPEKSKIDDLAKSRDDMAKQVIPASLYPKHPELEKATRPKGPKADWL